MKTIICDRCGDTVSEYTATYISYPHFLCGPEEQQLCTGCALRLMDWVSLAKENEEVEE